MSFTAVLKRLQTQENPYPGLRPFERQEQHLFFGRDQQIAELVQRLEHNRFVAVLGVSGGGKSSLVRAGLIPALERGSVGEAGARWRMVVTRPAGAPFASLEADLLKNGLDPSGLRDSSHGLLQVARQLPREETLLVVVDQFEELFRYKDRKPFTEEESRSREAASCEAAEFVQLLLAASRQQPPVYIVLTMRSDYLGDCAEFRDLPETLNTCQYLVPRLTREQRKQAIEGPLGRTAIAPSLVQRILNDAGDEPDKLPVLQHALMRTWSQWQQSDPKGERSIQLEDYEAEAVGGLQHALDRHAEELLGTDPPDITIAKTIFRRLTAGTRRERRNPARLDELWELCEANTEEARATVTRVIDRFRQGEATFLAPREGALAPEQYIDITHESLIREWGRLRGWVAEEAESRATFLRIHDDAQLFARQEADLWRDPKLQIALDWWEENKPNAAWARPCLGQGPARDAGFRMAQDFLERSRQARQERAARIRRRRRTIEIIAVSVIVLMTTASIGLSVLYKRGKELQERMNAEHKLAVARALAFEVLVEPPESSEQVERSALYAAEAVTREATSNTLYTLQVALARLHKNTALPKQKTPVRGLSFSPDGSLAVASDDKNVTVYDKDKKEVQKLSGVDAVWTVAFSKDGKYLAMGGAGGARVFDTATGKEMWNTTSGQVAALAFSPDGRLLATGTSGLVVVWDTGSGQEAWRLTVEGFVWAVAFSPDGQYLASGGEDQVVHLGNTSSRSEVRSVRLSGGVRSLAFDPSGGYLAVGNEVPDGTARVFEVAELKEVYQWPHKAAVTSIAFSPNGRYVATGSDDRVAHVFEFADRSEVLRQPHSSAVVAIAFSPDGRSLASSSLDGTVSTTEVPSPDEIALLKMSSEKFPSVVALTLDTQHTVVVDDGGSAQVFELKTGKSISPLIHLAGATQVAVSTGGRYVALGGGAEVVVFESATGQRSFSKQGLKEVKSLDLTPDGRYLAVATPRKIRVFDTQNSTLAWESAGFKPPISALAFSLDGKQLAVGDGQPALSVFRADTGGRVLQAPFQWRKDQCEELKGECKLNAIVFSRSGQYAVLSGSDSSVRVVPLANPSQIRELLLPRSVVYAVMSEDDRFVATGSNDLKGRVYELASGKEIWHMSLVEGDFFPLGFTSSDKYILRATGTRDLRVHQHLWRAEDLVQRACETVHRDLTEEEWGRLFADSKLKEPPPHTCSNRP